MLGKILVADDSVTIQKVIEMTLASEHCELESCLSEDGLFKKLHSNRYDLIVMDFNLSTKRSGIQIAEEIYRISKETPIMVMLGAFDGIDKKTWGETNICDKIVKPFNSKEFIEKCFNLLNKDEQLDANDHWSIGGTEGHKKFQEKDEEIWDNGDNFLSNENRLEVEVRDWGIGVPEVIGGDEINTSMESLPGIIKEETRAVVDNVLKDSLQEEVKEKDLENGLDINVDEFWSVDGEAETDEDFVKEKNYREDKNHQFDSNVTEEQIRNALKPALEEFVKKYCSQKVEEVAWEIIPDLAENLIRSEIKEISQRLTNG